MTNVFSARSHHRCVVWRCVLPAIALAAGLAQTGCDLSGHFSENTQLAVTGATVAFRDEAGPGGWAVDSYLDGESFTGIDSVLASEGPEAHPVGYRRTVSLGREAWLVAEIYTRDPTSRVSDFLGTVPDPQRPSRPVIRMSTPAHTDGLILRSREPLPEEYRIRLRIGHIRYGGTDPMNGYDSGDETGEPWMSIPAAGHNGVYWGAIMDARPQPRENIWSHHHRKFFIDTWNYRKRMLGVTVAAVDGKSSTSARTGKSFIAYDGHEWRRGSSGPAFHYLPDQWYQVVIERVDGRFRFSVDGEFHGIGRYQFKNELDIESNCVYHHNRRPSDLDRGCLIGDVLESANGIAEVWPFGSAYPDYFMLGDPHINFYEGSVLVDALELERL